MKHSLLALCTLLGGMLSASAEEPNYTLDVQFTNVPDSVIFTLGSDDDVCHYRQKLPVIGNAIHYSLDIKEDQPVPLYVIGKNPTNKSDRFYFSFYGGKGEHQIIVSRADGFSTDSVTISGAPWDEVQMQYLQMFTDFNHRQSALNALIDSLGTASADGKTINISSEERPRYMALTDERQSNQEKLDQDVARWCMENPQSPSVLRHLAKGGYNRISREDLAKFAQEVPERLRAMPEYQIIEQILSTRTIAIGDKLEDFDIVGEDTEGKPTRLSQFTTPYILLDFNSLGCGPCRGAARMEFPELLTKYGDSLTIVSFCVDPDIESFRKVHELDHPTWPEIWNGKGFSGDDCIKYGVTGYPRFFLFGPDRTLLAEQSGWGYGLLHFFLEGHIGNPTPKEQ